MENLPIKAYDPNSVWLNNISHDSRIDYFFTQRKIIEYDEKLDEKTLERKKKKKSVTINFLAINLPNNQFKNISNLIVDIEIWGESKYHYTGSLTNKIGDFPSLLLKLDNDKELFIKLIYRDKEKMLKSFIKFIPILKRYQSIPE
uniref:Uncharacterized protein n=1 Tax=viral metagenome TaxID=1070528 RepID=A0A6C0J3U7_9ZZZZ